MLELEKSLQTIGEIPKKDYFYDDLSKIILDEKVATNDSAYSVTLKTAKRAPEFVVLTPKFLQYFKSVIEKLEYGVDVNVRNHFTSMLFFSFRCFEFKDGIPKLIHSDNSETKHDQSELSKLIKTVRMDIDKIIGKTEDSSY